MTACTDTPLPSRPTEAPTPPNLSPINSPPPRPSAAPPSLPPSLPLLLLDEEWPNRRAPFAVCQTGARPPFSFSSFALHWLPSSCQKPRPLLSPRSEVRRQTRADGPTLDATGRNFFPSFPSFPRGISRAAGFPAHCRGRPACHVRGVNRCIWQPVANGSGLGYLRATIDFVLLPAALCGESILRVSTFCFSCGIAIILLDVLTS